MNQIEDWHIKHIEDIEVKLAGANSFDSVSLTPAGIIAVIL